MEPNASKGSWLRPRLWRSAWLFTLVMMGVFGYTAFELVPPWLGFFLGADRRPLRREAALAFVNGLLVAYVVALIAAVMGTAVLVYLWLQSRSRGAAVPASYSLQARQLLLCVSVLLSLLALEAGAAAWRSWLHQSPRLPDVGSPAKAASEGASAFLPTSAGPSLLSQFATQEKGPTVEVDPLRILVIGESSGRGEPYHPWLSVGQIVAWRLEQVFPGRPIQVDIWAVGGAILEMMHNKLAGLTYRPDSLIVYVGHNEFQSRFGWVRDVDYYLDEDRVQLLPVPHFFVMRSLPRFSPLCQLVLETRERQRIDMMPPREFARELVDRPLCTAAESTAIVADFRRRLDAIAGYCETMGTLPIFIIPPSNDGGYDPSRSILAPETPRSERVAFARAVARARALEGKDRALAVRIDRELVERHPEFAETHYRLARLLEQTGSWEEARYHYVQSRERDAMPVRCPEPLRQVYREVAARHPAVLLVDGPRVLEAKSAHGILDYNFFHDAQHPNLDGYVALAEDVINQLGARRALGWSAATPVPVVDVKASVRHFGIDAARWTEICRREVWFFGASASFRFDPKFRKERAAAYQRAAAALQEGWTSAEAGIPGWVLPPKPASSHHIPPGQSR
ncbi:MAG: hypothetical protein ACHRXM_20520 [Isosphaerales bacterium]